MDFSYYDDHQKLKKINIQIGTDWSKLDIKNSLICSIFQKIDDGDNKVSEKEFGALKNLFSLADKYLKQSANNGVVENEELQEVLKQIRNNTIDIKDLKNWRIDNLDLSDYTFESIQKRYPSNKYDVRKNGNSISVYDKSTKKQILYITNTESNLTIYENLYTENEKYRFYNKNGNKWALKEYTADGKKHNVLADDIYKEISTKKLGFIPTTGKNLEKYVMKINVDNVLQVMWAYKGCYGQTLDEAIENEIMLDKGIKNKLINQLKKCLEKAYNYEPEFRIENSNEENGKKFRGNYLVIGDENKIVIENKDTGKTRTIDLNKLLGELPIESKIQLKDRLRFWSPEALMDLAVEVSSLRQADFIDKMMDETTAYYRTILDSITVDVSQSPDVEASLMHELGHAVDYNGRYLNTASTGSNKAFKDTFKKELDAYIKAGHKQCTGIGDKSNACYATTNEQEMFAECYCILVGSSCMFDDVITTYFPETLKAADKLLQEIRSMPDDKRH